MILHLDMGFAFEHLFSGFVTIAQIFSPSFPQRGSLGPVQRSAFQFNTQRRFLLGKRFLRAPFKRVPVLNVCVQTALGRISVSHGLTEAVIWTFGRS